MTSTHPRETQLVDWGAAVKAGLIAGLIFYVLNLILVPLNIGGSAGLVIRYMASVLRGSDVLPTALPEGNTSMFGEFLISLLVNVVISVGWGAIIAYIIHRGGLLTGIIGGALLGLAIYFINFYGLAAILGNDWMPALASWSIIFNHLVFGAVVGGVYEALEEEVYVPA